MSTNPRIPLPSPLDTKDPTAFEEFEHEETPIAQPSPITTGGIRRSCLIRLTGAQLGEVIVIRGEMVVGRDRPSGISLPHDRGASREHAKIIEIDGGARLVDLGSTNGTYVDGVRIQDCVLVEGAKVRIGQTSVLKFARYDEAEIVMQRRLVDEALRDGMTRVFNRRYFMERLDAEIGFGERHHSPVSLVMFDVDRFKALNDIHGHLVGDKILIAIANVCLETARSEDVVARYGGEEFVVMLRGIHHDGAVRVGERLRCAVELAALGAHLAPPRPLTISVGVATLSGGDFKPLATAGERLVASADAALYRAKRAGRNIVCS